MVGGGPERHTEDLEYFPDNACQRCVLKAHLCKGKERRMLVRFSRE